MLSLVLPGVEWRRPWLPIRVAVTILFAESISGLLKDELGRARPPLADPDPAPLVGLPATSSFPSGHATVAFACATALAFGRPRLAPWLFALAALIAFSRVYVGVHYPFDVAAGAVLGVAIALALRAGGELLRRFVRSRVARRRSG